MNSSLLNESPVLVQPDHPAPNPPYIDFMLPLLTPSFAAVLSTTGARGRCLATNVKQRSQLPAFVFDIWSFSDGDSLLQKPLSLKEVYIY